jgi:hypothetical protein
MRAGDARRMLRPPEAAQEVVRRSLDVERVEGRHNPKWEGMYRRCGALK